MTEAEREALVFEVAEAIELTHVHFSSEDCAAALIAELAKRGIELARKENDDAR